MIQIRKKNEGSYDFQLKSETGQILLKSRPFSSKIDVLHIIDRLKIRKEPLNKVERKTNHEGKFLFQLKNDEGNIIGESNLYNSEAGMENGIKNFNRRLSSISDL